jgi:tRNA threonylcarbamoyl adenosine modification protein YeaZ
VRLLAIDSTTATLLLALVDAQGQGPTQAHPTGRNHATHLLPLVAELLKGEARPVAVAAAAGPGSYTGIRIGMATAEGLARGFAVPALAVPTFLGWAAEAAAEGPVLTALDARGGRVFAAVYDGDRELLPPGLYETEAIRVDWANCLLVAAEPELLPDWPRRRRPTGRGLALVAWRWLAEGAIPPFRPLYIRPPAVDQGR